MKKNMLLNPYSLIIANGPITGSTTKNSDKRMGIPFIVLIFLSIFLLFSCAPGGGITGGIIDSFSADMVMISDDGMILSTSKIYVVPGKYRMDGMPGPEMFAMPKTNITALGFRNENREYIYNHDKKLVYEIKTDDMDLSQFLRPWDETDIVEVLGEEKLSGYLCKKMKVSKTINVGSASDRMDIKIDMTIWQSPQFEMPLRSQSEEGFITEFRNINTSKPSPDLFKRPEGYRNTGNIMEAMGMDFFGMDQDDISDDHANPDQEIDYDEMFETVEKMMESAALSPEERAMNREILASARDKAKKTDYSDGAADDMWEIIPRHGQDKVGSEVRMDNIFSATLGTNSSINAVFDFYDKNLTSRGWNVNSRTIHQGMGFIMMTGENKMLRISSADDPGMKGQYKNFYNVQLMPF
jgi:hypothetical protein